MKIVKVGWDNENTFLPMILLDMKTRNQLNVGRGETVQVMKDSKSCIAGVDLQFRELIGKGVSVNTLLKDRLGLNIGDSVIIRCMRLMEEHGND